MKNTKSRKKMLLSSVAMLLVALVALGSATYAWFTINKEVKADTINVTAATTQGLEINNSVTPAWGRTVSFEGNAELNPVSVNAVLGSAFPANGFYAQDVADDGVYTTSPAASASGFTSTSVTPAVSVTAGEKMQGKNSYAAAYKMQIRSSDGEAIARAVTATITATGDGTAFAKACLVDSNGNVVANFGDAYNAITAATPTVSDTAYAATPSAQVLASVAASTTYDYTLYVWYEGNDTNCDDNHQGQTAAFTVTFTLANA